MDVLAWVWRISVRMAHWFALSALKLVWALLMELARLGWRGLKGPSITFGSARWAHPGEIRAANLFAPAGILLGKVSSWWGSKPLRFAHDGHVLVFAGSGAGKGVGLVIPNLLDYPGSVICTDIKGENFAIAARRRRAFGKVYALNVGDPERSDCFNPLDTVRLGSTHEVDDAALIASLMVMPDPQGKHWDDKARNRLTGFILHVLHAYRGRPELCTLAELRRLTMQGPEDFKDTLTAMATHPSPTVRDTANDLKRMGEEEMGSVLSTMEKATAIWAADRPLAQIASRSDFDLNGIKREPMSLFLVVPEDRLSAYAPFLRVMVGLAVAALTRDKGERPKHEVLLLLDEVAALGYLEPVETAVGYLRAYGRIMLVFQDLGQMQAVYPKARSMIANAAVRIAFGVRDLETAEMLSNMVGATTVRGRSEGQYQNVDDVMAQRRQAGLSEAGRRLLDPAEVMRLTPDEVLIFLPAMAPVKAQKLRYYDTGLFALERRWKGLYDRWRA